MGTENNSGTLSKLGSLKTINNGPRSEDFLYHMVSLIGPSKFGRLIKSNSDTVWSRVEKPGQFRYAEMKVYAKALEVTIEEFGEILDNQEACNTELKKKRQPYGRKKYMKEQGKAPRETGEAPVSPAKKATKGKKKRS